MDLRPVPCCCNKLTNLFHFEPKFPPGQGSTDGVAPEGGWRGGGGRGRGGEGEGEGRGTTIHTLMGDLDRAVLLKEPLRGEGEGRGGGLETGEKPTAIQN